MRFYHTPAPDDEGLIRELVHFCFACVPGCGQMSQGYMKRGISQTIIFCAALFVVVFMEMGALSVLVVPLWLYSFFDSYNLRRQTREGAEPEDAYMFGLSEMDARRLNQIIGKRHSLIGWILVVAGLYSFYHIVAYRFLRGMRDLFPWLDWAYDLLVWDAPRILGSILIFALGLWFIRGPKVPPSDDAPSFTPPPPKKETPPEMKKSPWTEGEKQFHEEPEPEAPDPSALTWESEFNVEKFEKEAGDGKREDGHDGGGE